MTNTVTHHLTDDILRDYAAGTLPEAFSVVVATHLSMCDECRAALAAHEALGGALLDEGDSVPMSAGGFAACLDRLDKTPAPVATQIRLQPGALPAPLRDYVGGDLDAVAWRNVGGGIRQAMLQTGGKASVRLLSIPGGKAVPDHGHHGREVTLVLKGAYRDEHHRIGPGDVEVAGEDLHHQPIAEAGEDCICLAATDAPLRFRSWLPRLAQRWMGI